jgi:threonine aldolase
MREAMLVAEVGDDMSGEDPTVRELEAYCAKLLGKEASMFVVSGTMGNLICVNAQTKPGDSIIFERTSHICNSEANGYARISGLAAAPVDGVKGVMPLESVRRAYKPGDLHTPKTGLIAVENTHNLSGGFVMPAAAMRDIYEFARSVNIPVHLDGARIFNAASYLNCDVKELTQYCDTVSMCFSKGLCAPVGAVVAGTRRFVEKARGVRKLVGGAMRQAGVLAAPALVAVRTMRGRLNEDRRRAVLLGKIFRDAGLQVDQDIQSNIVMVQVPETAGFDARDMVDMLAAKDVHCLALSKEQVRLVTHYYIDDAAVEYTARAVKEIFSRRQLI